MWFTLYLSYYFLLFIVHHYHSINHSPSFFIYFTRDLNTSKDPTSCTLVWAHRELYLPNCLLKGCRILNYSKHIDFERSWWLFHARWALQDYEWGRIHQDSPNYWQLRKEMDWWDANSHHKCSHLILRKCIRIIWNQDAITWLSSRMN